MDTSASLLHRLQERGDEADWQRLVWLYTPLIRTWLGRHVAQPGDVDDLVQQVFTVVVSKLPAFVHSGRTGAFRHWLRSITVNHLHSYWRDRRPLAEQAEMAVVLDQLTDPASELSRQWDREHDWHVARRLPDRSVFAAPPARPLRQCRRHSTHVAPAQPAAALPVAAEGEDP
jgi:RNA polymerase sigma-70 factor (ECF subfamily)